MRKNQFLAIFGCLAMVALAFSLTLSCRATVMNEYPLPVGGSGPQGIVRGPDGAYWTANFIYGTIGRMNSDGSGKTNFTITTAGSQPYGIAVGPDNNIWFTEAHGNKIGRMSTNGTMIAEYPVQTNGAGTVIVVVPGGMTLGPDNRLWFTEYYGNAIGAINTNGVITNYTNNIPGLPGNSSCGPYTITPGPDGNLWFTENNIGRIGCIGTDGTVKLNYPLFNTNNQPLGIVAGPDGNIWFTEYLSNLIGRLDLGILATNPVSTNALKEFVVPTLGASPYGITAGSDGNIWFTESLVAQVGRVTLGSTNPVTEFLIPTGASFAPEAAFMTPGPDGNIYFTEYTGNNMGQILLRGPALSIRSISKTQVIISWPTNIVGYQIQSNSSLTGAGIWTTFFNPPTVVGTNNTYTNSSAGTNYFRLIH